MKKPKPTVLIVDDCAAIRKMIAEVLRLEGWPLVEPTATNGREGLQVMRGSAEPLVVLTGICMPVMDGLEMLHRAEEDGLLERHAVLILSARVGLPHYAAELKRLDERHHIEAMPKPFTADQLIEGIKRAAARLADRG